MSDITTDTDILEMLAQGATHAEIKDTLGVGSARITWLRSLHGFERVQGGRARDALSEMEEAGEMGVRIDLLGDALERAGYRRHTVKATCGEFAPRLPSRSAFDTQSIMGSHF